mmetsp:Transcript_13853/g.20417  ORF Transcript_13853/g.20417 Transcript_13853/m.20417 type:complete len:88 (-) Transcript_13853:23-286(-)
MATSSPITKTFSSRAISSSIAWFRASLTDISIVAMVLICGATSLEPCFGIAPARGLSLRKVDSIFIKLKENNLDYKSKRDGRRCSKT